TEVGGPRRRLGVAAPAGAPTALLAAAGLLGAGTLAFAATPESRAWRASSATEPARGGAIRSRGMRTIVIAVGLAGATFGAIEVAVPAASQAAGARGAT